MRALPTKDADGIANSEDTERTDPHVGAVSCGYPVLSKQFGSLH